MNSCVCGGKKTKNAKKCIKCFDGGRRENNYNWKGGTIKHQGYIMINIGGKKRYIFEHVLVMEKHLKRKLFVGENVHHVNGIKTDNRLKNLELWIRPQPVGVRASDAVRWAKEIIKRYLPPLPH